jgi:hypothetical protein
MIWESYRDTFSALKAEVARAREAGRVERHERALATLDAFVATVTTDPRKLRAIAAVSPSAAAEIRARAASVPAPRTVLDPVHDLSFTKLWVASLAEEQVRMLQQALAEEVVRRRRAPLAAAE